MPVVPRTQGRARGARPQPDKRLGACDRIEWTARMQRVVPRSRCQRTGTMMFLSSVDGANEVAPSEKGSA